MGRKTFESIGTPLKKRQNIILSKNPEYSAPGCEIAGSIETALELCPPEAEIMVGGGASVYRQFLPEAERIYLTVIEAQFSGDRYFPRFNRNNWQRKQLKQHAGGPENPWPFTINLYTRIDQLPHKPS